MTDLQEFRQHALDCETLAERSVSTSEREHLLSLAQTWRRMVADMEASGSFVNAINGIAYAHIPRRAAATSTTCRG